MKGEDVGNKLKELVAQSGLTPSKAKVILSEFSNFFELASEWEEKARAIVVSRDDQTAEMQMARTGRLFMRDMRLKVEKRRKELKEQALREGKAIDGIANVLKAVIAPVEEYLDKQENFVKHREEEKARIEAEEKAKKEEAERIAAEKAERERLAKIEAENKKLREDAERKEKERQAELAKIKADEEAREKKHKEELARIEAEKKTEKEVAKQITCPKCGHKFHL